MTLHVPTLLLAASLIGVVVSALYLAEIARHGRLTAADRCWVVTFASAILATLSYAAAGLSEAMWLGAGLGDGGLVLTVGSLWSGARAFDRRPPRLWIPAAVALLNLAVVFRAGPEGGAWSGLAVYFPGMIAFTGLAAWTIWRGEVRAYPGARSLAAVCLVAGAFHSVRFVVALLYGVDSPQFTGYLGVDVSTVLHTVLLVVGAFAVMTIRSGSAVPALVATFTFDPYLGARTESSFRERAGEVLAGRAGSSGSPEASLVLLEVADLSAVGAAYGPRTVESVLERVVRTASEAAPQGALVGALDSSRARFAVLLPDSDGPTAERWVVLLRERLRQDPLAVDGDLLHLTVHAATAAGSGSMAELLRDAAETLAGTRPEPPPAGGARSQSVAEG